MAINVNIYNLIGMKKICYVLGFIFMSALSGCENEIDNLEAPNGGLHGTVYDMETNTPIPLPVEGSGGVLVSLFEIGTGATASIDFRANADGSYTNNRVFNGNYRILVNGPFIGVCEGYTKVNGQTQFDLKATPFSRIAASATISERNKVELTYKVTKADESFSLSNVSVMWNYTPRVDENNANYVTKVAKGKASEDTHTFELANDKQFVENFYKIKANGNKIYVRVSATVNNIVNYSEIIELIAND
ncbi:conserved hypothetical protein [Sphingobacterium sp. PM2-P1-29]|nr:hypothetical protein L950_0224875 [Sphingobacterium sp. IITKGP-BTPF85]CDS91537.1 conserved hypothetical protein [Sphingobacterium sp. PM2-P1-29]